MWFKKKKEEDLDARDTRAKALWDECKTKSAEAPWEPCISVEDMMKEEQAVYIPCVEDNEILRAPFPKQRCKLNKKECGDMDCRECVICNAELIKQAMYEIIKDV